MQQEEFASSGDALAAIGVIKTEVQDLGIPVDWSELPSSNEEWVLKILGFLLTTIAVAQGAPFWFELLGKLVNLRMAGN